MTDHTAPEAPAVDKHFSSSILLWMRQDRPREQGMAHWRGPHSGIIAATPGLLEYRQIHLAETNPGRWPAMDGVETEIPTDRKADGIAEVTFQSPLSLLMGRAQTQKAYTDEVNFMRRTLLYAGPPKSSRWWQVAEPGTPTGAATMIYLRRAEGVGRGTFRKAITKAFVPAAAAALPLTELRTQTFLPWTEKTWDTPNVAHDNPKEHHLHGSIMLGFADGAARDAFYSGPTIAELSSLLAPHVAAVHAYDVETVLTFVSEGTIL